MSYDLNVDRTIPAAPEVCFDAFVGMYGEDRPDWILESELDLREGGEWDVRFATPGNAPFREHRVITALGPRLLGYRMAVLTDAGEERFGTDVRITYDEAAGGTLVTLTQSGFPTEVDRDEFANAWPDVLALVEERATAG